MSAQTLLEQLLRSGLSMIQSGSSGSLPATRPGAPAAPPVSQGGPGWSAGPAPQGGKGGKDGFAWGTFAGGAASGSALTLLLGNKRARGYAGKALKVGSVAALGALAFKAYQHWQSQQAQPGVAGQAPAAPPAPTAPALRPSLTYGAAVPIGATADRASGAELEAHSRAMLAAMIAAAKSDGHLDERERSLLEAELQRLEADTAVRGWVEAELRRPLDPSEVARTATTPELAAEIYLASLLVIDETVTMERLYLQELARELRLPEGLKLQLEAQARDAAA